MERLLAITHEIASAYDIQTIKLFKTAYGCTNFDMSSFRFFLSDLINFLSIDMGTARPAKESTTPIAPSTPFTILLTSLSGICVVVVVVVLTAN